MIAAVSLLVVSSFVIWLSAVYIRQAVEALVTQTKISRLLISLLVFGAISSLPELGVTLNSIWLNSPQIALGNLIGSQIFLLFLVIPVLAIISRGLHIEMQLKRVPLFALLFVTALPLIALIDQNLTLPEIILILGSYIFFFVLLVGQNSLFTRVQNQILLPRPISPLLELGKLFTATAILFVATNSATRQLIEIAALVQTPRFMLSLLILPISTNLPELSLAFANLRSGRRDLALGDYLGTITINSLMMAYLAFSVGGSISIGQNIAPVTLVFIGGLAVFWWYSHSRKVITIKEGLGLLLIYALLLAAIVWVIVTSRTSLT